MRILHITPSVGPRSGGLGAVALALASRHRAAGHDAEIWTYDDPALAAEVARRESVEIVSCRSIGPTAQGFTPHGLRMARARQFDIVHQHGIWTPLSQITVSFRKRGVPTIVAPQGSLEPWTLRRSSWKKRMASLLYEARNLRGAGCLQATGDGEVRSFRDRGLAGTVAVLPNGVDRGWLTQPADGARFRARAGIGSHERVLLFLSRIDPKKGLPLFIEALGEIPDTDRGWTLVIAGVDERGHQGEVEALAAARGLGDAVRFVGPLFGQDKRDAFAGADLFVLPTHSDNFAIVVTEALGAGVPVLTTHGAPWRELVTYDAGWWVPVDAASMRGALSEALALSNAELRAKGARGLELVRTRYVWEAIVADSLELYAWLANAAARPSFVVG